MHVAIDPAAENVLAGPRRELRVPLIVDADGDDVLASLERFGDIERKAGVAPAVLTENFGAAYAAAAWLSWLANLIVAEGLLWSISRSGKSAAEL
jgi:hypothetical protein